MGYFFGGAATYQESVRRFEVYTAGKIYFDRPHNQLRSRRFYFSLIRFNTKGCRVGLKLAFGLVSIVALVVVPTTFRAHFSVLNLPLATMMVLGAHTTFRGWGIVGWHASVPPTIVVNAFPLVIILCYCLYHRCTPNEFYWRIKKHYEQQMFTDMEYKHELEAYAYSRKKGKFYCWLPWSRAEMERERELGTWRWTSGVEDGLVHLEQEEEKPAEEGEMAPGDDEMDEDKKILEALEQKRKKKAWWRIWRMGN
ncbi:hypothetical protein niasHT_038451 [Heterodera trifolii]|uniref:Uncharacterized protein n=1 Tax=Heterodera trifolii TaxID=157864 RepID=A0ABD2IX34_9BILA